MYKPTTLTHGLVCNRPLPLILQLSRSNHNHCLGSCKPQVVSELPFVHIDLGCTKSKRNKSRSLNQVKTKAQVPRPTAAYGFKTPNHSLENKSSHPPALGHLIICFSAHYDSILGSVGRLKNENKSCCSTVKSTKSVSLQHIFL